MLKLHLNALHSRLAGYQPISLLVCPDQLARQYSCRLYISLLGELFEIHP